MGKIIAGGMAQIPEAIIRDRLAENLSVLEPGLILVSKEFALSNAEGAGGRIDILARDQFKNFVIIEIKRSDAAARQALHEIIKYASILMRDQGIKPTKLRVIIVSTEWHELWKPFSEYIINPVCHTIGYKIEVDTTGAIIRSELVKPLALVAPIEFSPTQLIYLYVDPTVRENALPYIYKALNEVDASDHVLIRCNYSGTDPNIIFPYGIYIVIAAYRLSDDDNVDAGLWGTAEDRLLQQFTKFEDLCDTAESGGRDSLAKMLQSGWCLDIAARSGRFKKSEGLLTDDELLDSLVTFDDASHFWMCTQATPRFEEQWIEFRRHLDSILAGNSLWQGAVARLLDEIAMRDSEAKVSVDVFNLADTAQMLDGLANDSFAFFPTLEIVSAETDGVRLYMSRPVWNGRTATLDAETFFRTIYGSFTDYMSLRYGGEVFKRDDRAREALGLETLLLERIQNNDGTILIHAIELYDGKIERSVWPSTESYHGIGEFVKANIHFFRTWRVQVPQMGPLMES